MSVQANRQGMTVSGAPTSSPKGDESVAQSGPSAIELELQERCLRIHFQPIVDLKTHAIFAQEGLARSTTKRFPSPVEMFEQSLEMGVCGQLGRHLRELCVEGCPDTTLFVNINPNEFNEGWLVRPDDPIFGHTEDMYLEITESVPLSYFEQCNSVLAEIRSKGLNLAVDDFGAGFSNIKYIADLSPEIVKLDRNLVMSLDKNVRQQKLVRHIVRLCVEMGAKVVAEGIETAEELKAVIDAGVHFGQGYLLARPAFPPPAIKWPV